MTPSGTGFKQATLTEQKLYACVRILSQLDDVVTRWITFHDVPDEDTYLLNLHYSMNHIPA